jgi:putative membrane protein
MTSGFIPYCGLPPVPGGLSWNFDPILIAALVALGTGHLWLMRREDGSRRFMAVAGWTVVAIALVSPLCNLSVALFSARMTQHVVITLIGAPLIAFAMGRPGALRQHLPAKAEAMTAPLAFAAFLWLWCGMPGAYNETLRDNGVYWLMHVTLFASALWFWRVLLDGETLQPLGAFLVSLVTGFQMSILGAVLALNDRALFSVHFATAGAWGMTPLEDQQVGGMIMWVPAGILVTGYAIFLFGMALRRMEAADRLPAR